MPNKSDKILNDQEIPNKDYLGVWVETIDPLQDPSGKLNIDFINLELLPHYSTNKIPPSQVSDLNIYFFDDYKKQYRADWNEGQDGIYPPPEHFGFSDQRKFFFMLIEEINYYKGTYTQVGKNQQFQFELNVVHKPLVANLWHFEFSIKSDHGQVKRIEPNSKGQKMLIGASIRSHIRQIAKFEIS